MHRDLKPDNILIGVDKDIKISDFGLARESSNSIFVTGQMGTPLYAAPEVYLHKYEEAYTERCDVWGAGMILYEMLTQKVLFEVKVTLLISRPTKTSRNSGSSTKLIREESSMDLNYILIGSFSQTICLPMITRKDLLSMRSLINSRKSMTR